MNTKAAITLAILVLAVVVISGCTQTTSQNNQNPQTGVPDGYNPDGTPIKEENKSIANDTVKDSNYTQPNTNNKNQNSEEKPKFEVYPQTSSAPVLHMYWNKAKTAEIPLDEIHHIGRFGLWEGGITHGPGYKSGLEPATEIEIHTTNKVQPIYALASGTITELKVDNEGIH